MSNLSKQDKDAAKLNKAKVVQRVAFIANHEPTKIAQPGEQPLDLPTPLVTPQWSAILRLGLLPIAPMRRDHLDAELRQLFIEWIGVVRAIADEALGQGQRRIASRA